MASALEMSGATSGLNEIFVHGRLPLREAAEEARARHAPLRVYAPSAAKILFTVRERVFQRVCETRPVADISITPIAKA